MDNSDAKNQKPRTDAPLEIEQPPAPRARLPNEFSYASRGQALAEEASARHARSSAAARATKKYEDASPDFLGVIWKSFVGVGVVSAVYFISLAFTHPEYFREGIGFLWPAVRQLAVTVALWGGGLWIYRRASAESQRRIEWSFIYICGALVFMLLLYSLGAFEPKGRRLWASPVYLLSLSLQASAVFLLLRLRKNLKEQAEIGEKVFNFTQPLIYFTEGLSFYFFLGLFLQVFARIHVPAILGAIAQDPKALLLFFFPLLGYVLLRKLMEA